MLLTRRPDVAAAEQRVVAANAQIGVATAQLYPAFSLPSTAGFESANVTNLVNWQSTIVSLVAGATAPIFQEADSRRTSKRRKRSIARRWLPTSIRCWSRTGMWKMR